MLNHNCLTRPGDRSACPEGAIFWFECQLNEAPAIQEGFLGAYDYYDDCIVYISDSMHPDYPFTDESLVLYGPPQGFEGGMEWFNATRETYWLS